MGEVGIFMELAACFHIARKIVPALMLVLLLVSAFSQTLEVSKSESSRLKDPLDRKSPQSSVYSFLQACHAHDYDKAAKYLDLRKLPPDQRLKNGPQLAQQLQRILDRDAQFDVANFSNDPEGSRAENLPPNRERIDSFTVNGQTLDLELERVILRSGIHVWLFSSDSVDRIPQIVRLTRSEEH